MVKTFFSTGPSYPQPGAAAPSPIITTMASVESGRPGSTRRVIEESSTSVQRRTSGRDRRWADLSRRRAPVSRRPIDGRTGADRLDSLADVGYRQLVVVRNDSHY